MSDDDAKGPGPTSLSVTGALKAVTRTPVEVLEPAFIVGEVKLADGTVLKLRILVNTAYRLEGLTDEAGRPAYQLESLVIPSVVKWEAKP